MKLKMLYWAPLLFAAATVQQTPTPISWKDVPSWISIAPLSVQISPDGGHVAYAMLPVEGDGELIVRKTSDAAGVRSYPIGSTNSASYAFAENGKWIAFKEHAKEKDKKAAAKTPSKQLFEKLVLVDMATGKKTEFEKVNSFAFNGTAATHLAVLHAKEKAPGARPDDPKGADLLLVELASGKSQNIGNVSEYAFNKAGAWLAYTIDAAGQSGNGLHLYNVAMRTTQVIDSDKAGYKSVTWTEAGDGFAALKLEKDKKFKQEKGSVVGVRNLTPLQVVQYSPAKDSLLFPKSHTISAHRAPMWTEDLTRLLFGVTKLEPVKKTDVKQSANKDSVAVANAALLAKIRADTSIRSIADLQKAIEKAEAKTGAKADTLKPDMTLWHWQDKRLQSRQQVQENQDKNFSFWGMYDATAAKYTLLNDSALKQLTPLSKHRYALGEDNRNYELDANLDGRMFQDVYVVDLKTGQRTLVFEKFYAPSNASLPRSSPDGAKLLFGQDGHYHVYDIATKKSVNITGRIKTTFVNTEADHNVVKPLVPAIGWSSDSRYVLLRDLWDIWQVEVATAQAVNLTQNGRREKIRYQSRFVLDPDEKGIDLKKPQYIRLYGELTKKSGFARLEPGKAGLMPGAKRLLWDDVAVTRLLKAKNSESYLFGKEKFNQPTEYFVADALLTGARQVSQNAPDAGKYAWSAGVQLVNYLSGKGDSLQGALFLPAGYEQGKKYPTVVYYYEKLSQTLHSYTPPGFSGTGWNPNVYTSNGYAVFIPDIVYKINDPGMSAVWCVLPGVKAALTTGVIDEDRMGIHGHSWGGYQTCFLITQTNLFKAAAAGAPLTNMVSMYDLIYWNTGGGNMSIFEASQGRFTGGPWENWDAYLRNSPVYHVKNVSTPLLMLHNDKDGAVDFTQGIEFYNALRRLKKPVVLVQYKGENHGLVKMENRKDYAVRMMEFFDHHLKGRPAPEWLQNGVDRLKLSEHLENRLFENE
jgi:dipeptidyl aminopeptidase/acylaminoacyl peptidase